MDIHTNIELARLHQADRLAVAASDRRARLARTSRWPTRQWGGRTGDRPLTRPADPATSATTEPKLSFGR